MKKLVITALVLICATSAFGHGGGHGHNHATPPWQEDCSVDIPVIMDIMPVCAIDLNNSVIKLELSNETDNDGEIWYEGVADPMPTLHANVSVKITATIAALEPTIESSGNEVNAFHVALRNGDYTANEAGPVQYDPLVIGSGIDIEIAAAILNPDLSVRAEGLDIPVAVVTLTASPMPF